MKNIKNSIEDPEIHNQVKIIYKKELRTKLTRMEIKKRTQQDHVIQKGTQIYPKLKTKNIPKTTCTEKNQKENNK